MLRGPASEPVGTYEVRAEGQNLRSGADVRNVRYRRRPAWLGEGRQWQQTGGGHCAARCG